MAYFGEDDLGLLVGVVALNGLEVVRREVKPDV